MKIKIMHMKIVLLLWFGLCRGMELGLTGVEGSFKNDYPLHYAAEMGDVKKVEALLAEGYDVDQRDVKDNTPLHYAKNVAILIVLLKAGADVDAQNRDKKTALHFFVYQEDAAAIAKLREYGARDDIKDEEEKTAKEMMQEYVQLAQGIANYHARAERQAEVKVLQDAFKPKSTVKTPQAKSLLSMLQRALKSLSKKLTALRSAVQKIAITP